MFNLLHTHIKKVVSQYPEEEFNLLQRCIQVKEVPKKTIWLREGNICQYGSYVVKGCFRFYTTNYEGLELISHFAVEDWWIGDVQSILYKTPSKFSIEALEDSTLLSIPSVDYNYLLNQSPAFSDFKRKVRSRAYQAAIERSANLRENAEARYNKLLSIYPGLVNRIPQYYIASYLGITPESLSRLRKNIDR